MLYIFRVIKIRTFPGFGEFYFLKIGFYFEGAERKQRGEGWLSDSGKLGLKPPRCTSVEQMLQRRSAEEYFGSAREQGSGDEQLSEPVQRSEVGSALKFGSESAGLLGDLKKVHALRSPAGKFRVNRKP